MSKKTREEKIIAELRRKLSDLKTPSLDNSSVKTPVKEAKPVLSFPNLPKKEVVRAAQNTFVYDYSLVAKDLRKTFFLTTLALSLEFVLYFILK